MSTEDCLDHWSGSHAAIGAQLPRLRGYVQNHGVLDGGRFLLPYPGFDIMPELDWDDLAAMDAAIDSPIHENDSLDDELLFLDTSRTGLAVTERKVLYPGAPRDTAVKLITLFRSAATSSPAALAGALRGEYAEIAAEARPLRHELLVTIANRPGRPPFSCEAIDLLWFSSPADALAYSGSDVYQRALHALAGRAFGSERLIARPQRVV